MVSFCSDLPIGYASLCEKKNRKGFWLNCGAMPRPDKKGHALSGATSLARGRVDQTTWGGGVSDKDSEMMDSLTHRGLMLKSMGRRHKGRR